MHMSAFDPMAAPGSSVERKRAPYAVKSCDQCRKRRLKCQPVVGRQDCVRCASRGMQCSGVIGPSQQRAETTDQVVATLPTAQLALSPPKHTAPIVHLNRLTENQVSYAYSFHLLNSHLDSERNCVATDCWVVFQGAYYRTGGIAQSTQRLVGYISDLADCMEKPQLALTSALHRVSPAFTQIDSEILAIIDKSAELRHATLEDAEESIGLLVHAADTVEAVEAGNMHRLHGVSASSFLPLVARSKSERDFGNWSTTLELARSLSTASMLFALAHGGVTNKVIRSLFDSLWPYGIAAQGLAPLHTPTSPEMSLIFSPTLSESLLDLTRQSILSPLVSRLRASMEVLVSRPADASQSSVLCIWEWTDSILGYIERMFQSIAQHSEYQKLASQTTSTTTNGAQFVLRELILVEQLSAWVLIATHKRLRTCLFVNHHVWTDLSREKMKAVVRKLETRLDVLLALAIRPVHFARLMQMLGRTIEAAFRTLQDDYAIASRLLEMEVDEKIAGTATGNAPRRDDENFASSLRMAADRKAGRRPEKFDFIASALEDGMRALSLSATSETSTGSRNHSRSPPNPAHSIKRERTSDMTGSPSYGRDGHATSQRRRSSSSAAVHSDSDFVPGMSSGTSTTSRESSLTVSSPSSASDRNVLVTSSAENSKGQIELAREMVTHALRDLQGVRV
ncbi:hypothetical protein ACM66B_006461 [Microbotryomycetes sp. NB124-2]